jgi:uncharacterized protein (TIGR03437 family)
MASVIWLAGAHAQVTISYVSNAASYIYAPLPNSSIAQGSFFVILGTGISGSATANWGSYPLPTTLAGTSVDVTVAGTTTIAFMYYVGPSWGTSSMQIDAVLPSTTPTGAGALVVTQNGVASQPFPILVVASSPGVLSRNGNGTGPGLFYNIAANGALTQNDLFHTAKPGQTVALHGTGLGPTADVPQEGIQPPGQVDVRNSNYLVEVWVANQQATVRYAGRSSYTAEDEIDFTVPSGITGCYNEVAVYAGSPGNQTVSNFTSLSVDPKGKPCQDADGINVNDLAVAIKGKGSANVGAISLLSNYIPLNLLGSVIPWDMDTVNGEIVTLTTQQLDASFGFPVLPSVNSCAVTPYLGFPPPTDPVFGSIFGPVTYLDAGETLTIQGLNGTQSIPKNANGEDYSSLVGGAYITCPPSNPGCPNLLSGDGLPPYFLTYTSSNGVDTPTGIVSGSYTLSGPGGSVVGPFSGSITVTPAAAAFKWTNVPASGSTLSRNQDLSVTWTGGDPNGFVGITLVASTTQALIPLATTPGVLLQCVAPASAGSFTIPKQVLAAVPATVSAAVSPIAAWIQTGPLSGAAPVTPAPSGLDAAYLFYHFVSGVPVAFQ